VELPERVPEDDYYYRKDKQGMVPAPILGIGVELNLFPIKSFEQTRHIETKNNLNLTFCSKDCMIGFLNRNLTEDGKIKKE
jgi:hypothetical protein